MLGLCLIATASAGDESGNEVQAAALQQPQPELQLEQMQEYQIQLEPPSAERVFRIQSEQNLQERLRQEGRQRGQRIQFPKELPLERHDMERKPRQWQAALAVVEATYVCYNPLFFEDKNTERYAWDAGIFQPFISTGKFWLDTIMMPYNCGVLSCCDTECNTGYALPGDPVPYVLYIPECSWKGFLYQTAVVAGGIAVFP